MKHPRIAKAIRRPLISTWSRKWAYHSRMQFGVKGKGVNTKYTLSVLGIINGILPLIKRKMYVEGAVYKSGSREDYRNWDYSECYIKIRKSIPHEQREEIT